MPMHRGTCLLVVAGTVAGTVAGLLVGCAGGPSRTVEERSPMRRVELLYFKGCPNTTIVCREAERAVAALGASWRLDVIDLESLPKTDLRRGYGSPSILLAGREVFGEPVPTDSGLSCRAFPDGPPDAAKIRAALLAGDRERTP